MPESFDVPTIWFINFFCFKAGEKSNTSTALPISISNATAGFQSDGRKVCSSLRKKICNNNATVIELFIITQGCFNKMIRSAFYRMVTNKFCGT
mmetsp:Transcript_15114/g.26828  ORF Transcript_15114/g.26828 Transcript_15114/m.26828 type:complete len:94 (-) Transcript_15114:878-1159(-)